MDSIHRSNKISSNERDRKELINNENSSTTRSYDCTFCKRGFTNAQALGGHMNIHRKDKAKAKKLTESSDSHKASACFAPISSEQVQFYAALRASKSYELFSSSPNPIYPPAYIPQRVSSRDLLTPYVDFMGSNSSLRVGLSIMRESRKEIKMEDLVERNWFGNDHVDLELRLGQNP